MIKRHPQASWDASGVLSFGGRPLLSLPPQRGWALPPPYVGLPFPPIQIPAFPVNTGPAQGPGPLSPAHPQSPAPQGPSLAEVEAANVSAALAVEVKAVDSTYDTGPLFAQAADYWQKAGQAAAQIASATVASAPVTSDNASVRAYAYHVRQLKDQAVANGTAQHPRVTGEVTGPFGQGWGWPPIPQKDESGVPVYNPRPGPSVPGSGSQGEPQAAPQGGSGALLGVAIALLAVAAAVVYSGARAGRG